MRTLQFYDKEGLLSPSGYTDAGYRLYSDDDLVKCQQILALKYLGFSLREIKSLLQAGSNSFQSALSAQKQMMLEKREQIDAIVQAIERIEQYADNPAEYHSIVKILEVMQMDLKPEWVSKYLTNDERRALREVAKQSFSGEALQKLTRQEFTEEMHQEYGNFREELRSLVAQKMDPSTQEAQRLAQHLMDLNRRLSQNWDEDILTGLKKSWDGFNALPEDKKPPIYRLSMEERAFMKEACSVLYRRKIVE